MVTPKKIGIITQARATSSRLPRKVLIVLDDKTVLEHHLDRLSWSKIPIYVATTINETDNEIVSICQNLGIPYHRGSENDVLSRFYECALKHNLDIVVRVTSDCPLIDGYLIKQGLDEYFSYADAYVSNCIERTFPRGLDFEIFSFKSLEKAFLNATDPAEREHVTPFIRNPDKNGNLSLINIIRKKNANNFRITLDEEADLILIKKLFEQFHCADKTAEEIIYLLEGNPDLANINALVEQKKV